MATKYETPVESGLAQHSEQPIGGERRVAGVLLLLYLAFILYGSFSPFHFSDPAALSDQLATVVVSPWTSEGRRAFSIADLMSNILLGMPLGLLLVLRGLAGNSIASRLARVAALDVLLAGSIEIGQLFAPGRTTSLLELRDRTASIEWVPFASYYSAVPKAALFDAGKKILLGALFGGAIHAAGWRRVSMIAFLVSALLETAQLFERSHHPAFTDVLLLTAGAVAGCFALRRYRELIRA